MEDLPKSERIKRHIKKHRVAYSVGGVVVIAGTFFMLGRYVGMRSGPNAWLNAKKIVIKDNIFLIRTYVRQQGPPSWIIECIETGDKFVSQAAAAREMGLSKAEISQYFNGNRHNVGGYTFARLAMAVPNSG